MVRTGARCGEGLQPLAAVRHLVYLRQHVDLVVCAPSFLGAPQFVHQQKFVPRKNVRRRCALFCSVHEFLL